MSREISMFDVPPLPFKELPKIPACFCSYPIIFSCTYDIAKKQWFWRLDMEAEVGGKFGHIEIPGPIGDDGNPVPFNVEYLALAMAIMAGKIKSWVKAGQPVKEG